MLKALMTLLIAVATSVFALGVAAQDKKPAAAPAANAANAASLDNRVQDLKTDVIKLNRDLLVLEEELLFPASTQVALFVSMDVGKLFGSTQRPASRRTWRPMPR